jgi:hypothetical protein
MSRDKETRPGAGTPRRARLEAETGQTPASIIQNTTLIPPEQAANQDDFLMGVR